LFPWLEEPERKRRLNNWFWPAVVFGLVGVGAVLLIALWPREELYQGKPFSYWLDHLYCKIVTPTGDVMPWAPYPTPALNQADLETHRQQADQARKIVRRVGGKHLPMLVRRLQSTDSPWKTAALNWAVRFHLIKAVWLYPADVRRGQALTAIIDLGYAAKPIFPELRELANDRDPQVRASAKYALDQIKPEEFERLERMQNARKGAVK
jgi:hypothetical protein